MSSRHYHNENDKLAAAWLRNLIAAGLIAPGDVDERSIADVKPDDLKAYAQCHFFAGIGGWSYALRLAGWPDDRPVWTGSCPCQPFSAAGKRKGNGDARHLWPEFHRLIGECRPATVFGEQVASKDGRLWLAGVRADLEALGYAVGAADLCAASAGAPHIRQRLFWVADARRSGDELGRRLGDVSSTAEGIESQAWERKRSGDAVADCSATSRLADAKHNGPSAVKQSGSTQDEGRLLESEGCSTTGGVGNANRRGQPRVADDGLYIGSDWHAEPIRDADGSCELGGMGDTARDRWRQECTLAGRGDEGNQAQGSTERFGPNHWSDAEWLPCLDGKARRIESGTFPLVTRLSEGMGSDRPGENSPFRIIRDSKTGQSIGQAPSRIGMLRGYGNAIVPQVAAEFVRAFLDT